MLGTIPSIQAKNAPTPVASAQVLHRIPGSGPPQHRPLGRADHGALHEGARQDRSGGQSQGWEGTDPFPEGRNDRRADERGRTQAHRLTHRVGEDPPEPEARLTVRSVPDRVHRRPF